MKILLSTISACVALVSFGQSYSPAAGQDGSTAIAHTSELFVGWANHCEIQRGFVNISEPDFQDNGSNYASHGAETDAVGIADGHVVSLGDGGVAVLTFAQPIANGPGFDFAVFENSFSDNYLELAFVEVSSDGQNFYRFPSHSQTQTETQISGFGALDPTYINNLAGKYRGMFGTPFDLDDLPNDPLLNKNKITHVRIIDVVGSIDPEYGTFDSYENIINDPFPTPFMSSGFDLDAVGVIHQFQLSTFEQNEFNPNLYPNPAKNYIFIDNIAPLDYVIYDVVGKVLKKGTTHKTNKINVSELEKGIYFIKLSKGQTQSLHKIIKE